LQEGQGCFRVLLSNKLFSSGQTLFDEVFAYLSDTA
jgi:hypothetical protein